MSEMKLIKYLGEKKSIFEKNMNRFHDFYYKHHLISAIIHSLGIDFVINYKTKQIVVKMNG